MMMALKTFTNTTRSQFRYFSFRDFANSVILFPFVEPLSVPHDKSSLVSGFVDAMQNLVVVELSFPAFMDEVWVRRVPPTLVRVT